MQDNAKPARPTNLVAGASGDWELVVGLEVHAQVNSRAKLFSGASTAFGGPPNSHVSLVDVAMPGMLPVINAECIAQAVRTGLGLKAQINLRSVFDRKNYFYPTCCRATRSASTSSRSWGRARSRSRSTATRSALASSGFTWSRTRASRSTTSTPECSYVDLNRSGVALMEIVSRPDMRSARQAQAYVTKLRTILRYLGTCDGDMEKGNLRADVNVSVRRPGAPLSTRCEIKNVNSIRFIGQAIEAEARRQIGIVEDGGTIQQETRLFDPARGRRARCAPRRRRTTTATSPIPTSCRWSSPRPTSRTCAGTCPSCPTRRSSAS